MIGGLYGNERRKDGIMFSLIFYPQTNKKSTQKTSDVSQGDGNLLEKLLNLKYANILRQKLKNNEKSKVIFTQYDFSNCFCQC